MKMGNLEPWQQTSVKIVLEAINHANRQTEEESLIAFLLLDVGAETLLKTYLGLPKKATGAVTSDEERYAVLRKGFHEIVEAVKDSRQGISQRDLTRVEYFHGIRNTLYHQGNGLTVQRSHLDEYMNVIKNLFIQLLKIDLNEYLVSTRLTKDQMLRISDLRNSVNTELDVSHKLRKELELERDLVVEKISPTLLLPSYTIRFSALLDKALSEETYNEIDGEVVACNVLPYSNDERAEIVLGFDKLTYPIVKSSKYIDKLYELVEVGNSFQLESINRMLGIKNIDIERQKTPRLFNIVFSDIFYLGKFYYNLVEIVVFQGESFVSEIDNLRFKVENLYPRQHDQSELTYWESVLDSIVRQNKTLKYFIAEIKDWLELENNLTQKSGSD